MICEVSTFFVVWSVSLITSALFARGAAFEPRDHAFNRTEANSGKIEVRNVPLEVLMDTPREIIAIVPEEFRRLCDTCPQCPSCVRHAQDPLLPRILLDKPDFYIFHGIEGDDVETALLNLTEQGFERELYRKAGLSPLRLWVGYCGLIVSFFPGVTRVCNCDPPPDAFQLLLPNLEKMIYLNTSSCKNRYFQCPVGIEGLPATGYYYSGDYRLPRLIGPEDKEMAFDFKLQNHEITLTLETLVQEGYNETFFAINRGQLARMAKKQFKHLNRFFPEIEDNLRHLLVNRIQGQQLGCYEIGKKEQTIHTFKIFREYSKI